MEEKKFSGLERRRFIRVAASAPVKFRLVEEKDRKKFSETYNATLKDISINALCMEISGLEKDIWERIKGGDNIIEVEVSLPGVEGSIKASGESLRLSQERGVLYYVGVIFTSISTEDREKLVGFIQKRLAERR